MAAMGLLCAAAPSRLTLDAGVPETLADTLTARAMRQAAVIGLTEVESLGKPYSLSRDGRVLGVLVSGRGRDGGSEGHGMTCFVAVAEPGGVSVSVLPTVGRGRWAGGDCHGYTALGLLPSGRGRVRLGILYDTGTQSSASPVVLAWRDGRPPSIDQAGTTACVSRHVVSIAEMRRPGCGRPSAVERAFPMAAP